MKTPHVSLILGSLALLAAPSLRATTDLSTLSPSANVTVSPSYGTDSAWVVSANTTVGGIAWTRTNPSQVFTFSGTTGSEVLTFSNTSTPSLTENSYYNGSLYWGSMHVVASSGINIATGFSNLILQSGLVWDSGSAGTMTFTQPASDGNIVYAQGNGVLAGTLDLNLGSGSAGSSLVINGGTTQTIGALTGTSSDYIGAYSDYTQFRNGIVPGGTNTTGSASVATLQIGNTNNSATFAGVIGSTGVSTVLTNANTEGISIVKLGTGTEIFTGTNTYTGGTTVEAGTLATGSTGTFGTGNVSVAAGATLTLGNSASLASTASLTFNSSLSTINLSFSGTQTLSSLYDTYTGTYLAVGTYDAAALNSFFDNSSAFTGTGELTVTSAIPEPATCAALAGFAALGLAFWARRRRA